MMQKTITFCGKHYVVVGKPYLVENGVVGVYVYCREDRSINGVSEVYLCMARVSKRGTGAIKDVGVLTDWSKDCFDVEGTGLYTQRTVGVSSVGNRQRTGIYR